jgi:predicted DNA-binding protein
MEVHFTPEWEAKLNEMATVTGRPADYLLQDAMAGYFEELTQARRMLDSRYDDLKSGKVKPVDGEAFFETLRQREAELLKKQAH